MDLDDRFRGAMGEEDKVLGLRAVAAELLAEGRSRDEVLAAFESLRDEARRDGREEDEDAILEVMDFLVGWCSPHMKML